MDNTFTWDGFTYLVKPFNLGNYFSLLEAITNSTQSNKIITDTFKGKCESLLEGTTEAARKHLTSGALVKSLLSSDKHEEVFEFSERLDFFTGSYVDRANALKQSAPDLTELLAQKEAKVSAPQSPKGTKRGRGHSG